MKFNRKEIHGGENNEKVTGEERNRVFKKYKMAQVSTGQPVGEYEYSRAANPTRQALEDALASIENGARGLAFASGLAATDCLLRLFKAGDEIIGAQATQDDAVVIVFLVIVGVEGPVLVERSRQKDIVNLLGEIHRDAVNADFQGHRSLFG